MNIVGISGNLTRDPELHTTKSGKKVAHFTIANNRRAGGEEDTLFLSCQAWEWNAEHICKHYKKGDGILLTGHLRQDSWEKDGERITKIILNVDDARFPPKGPQYTGPRGDEVVRASRGDERPRREPARAGKGAQQEEDSALPF